MSSNSLRKYHLNCRFKINRLVQILNKTSKNLFLIFSQKPWWELYSLLIKFNKSYCYNLCLNREISHPTNNFWNRSFVDKNGLSKRYQRTSPSILPFFFNVNFFLNFKRRFIFSNFFLVFTEANRPTLGRNVDFSHGCSTVLDNCERRWVYTLVIFNFLINLSTFVLFFYFFMGPSTYTDLLTFYVTCHYTSNNQKQYYSLSY
jgi:hypothetical protein